ncbi:MAG: hypothetical protein E7058_02905 [Lentisphaerae bacterium]|nr:hypothetical protein [Lentisphaerota bacterium]
MTNYPAWNEKQWENEIRKHESSLAEFFRDLVYCLDLPIGEMPSVLQNSTADAPLDPVTSRSKEALQQWVNDHESDDDIDSSLEYEPRRPVCFACVDALDQLAAEWNAFISGITDHRIFVDALGINCAFAKLLARSADFTEPDRDVPIALLITLGKRSLTDLENLVSLINIFEKNSGIDQHNCHYFCKRLALVRDQLIDKLSELQPGSINC